MSEYLNTAVQYTAETCQTVLNGCDGVDVQNPQEVIQSFATAAGKIVYTSVEDVVGTALQHPTAQDAVKQIGVSDIDAKSYLTIASLVVLAIIFFVIIKTIFGVLCCCGSKKSQKKEKVDPASESFDGQSSQEYTNSVRKRNSMAASVASPSSNYKTPYPAKTPATKLA